MDEKKIVIVGGGIAGLSAGIYARLAGFKTAIYEKNPVAGGNCSGWKRGDYFIDNCLHWMTGTKVDTPQYEIWKTLGALGDHVAIIERESFYTSTWEDKTITLWRDVDRTEEEMLALSPEDEKEIRNFIKYVKACEAMQHPRENPDDVRGRWNDFNQSLTPMEVVQAMMEYGGMTAKQLSERFVHPLLQRVMLDFMAPEYEAYWLVLAYAFFVAGNGDLPEGGSMGVVNNLVKRFKELGGELHLGAEVEKVVINKEKFKIETIIFSSKDMRLSKIKNITTQNADGILLKNGQLVQADYIICASGIHYSFYHLIGKKYMPKRVKSLLKSKKEHHIYSSYQVAFAIDGVFEEIDDTLSFDCMPIDVAHRAVERITLKNYRNYGEYIAPPGKTVMQCSIVQYKEDFKYWQKLYEDKARYDMAKNNVAMAVLTQILKRYPKYVGKIAILDCWTPMTYYTRNHCDYGAYMRYITTLASTKAFLPCEIPHLDNVYLASHGLRYPGGIPTAASTGKHAVDKIVHKESAPRPSLIPKKKKKEKKRKRKKEK